MTLRERAEAAGRDYLTPEDVRAAIDAGEDLATVRLEVLDILGHRWGVEDRSLCAFVAWKGERSLPRGETRTETSSGCRP